MDKPSKRGKIPQQDWPLIIKRYEAGETLASIALTYDCSPPAISYILSRSRERASTAGRPEPNVIESKEPRLLKADVPDVPKLDSGEASAPASSLPASDPTHASAVDPAASAEASTSNGAAGAIGNGSATAVETGAKHPAQGPAHLTALGNENSTGAHDMAGAGAEPAEARRTLHLSLPHDGNRPENSHQGGRDSHIGARSAVETVRAQPASSQHFTPQHPASSAAPGNGGAARPMAAPEKTREGGAFIDRALRDRVNGDISAFLAAFDAALANDTIESRAGLREATDRLLRAGARTRIELERLEARLPLSSRDLSRSPAPTWRQR
jgi:hypothetical protein